LEIYITYENFVLRILLGDVFEALDWRTFCVFPDIFRDKRQSLKVKITEFGFYKNLYASLSSKNAPKFINLIIKHYTKIS